MEEEKILPVVEEMHNTISQAVFPEDVFGKKLVFDDPDGNEREAETNEEKEEALYEAFKEWKYKLLPYTSFKGLTAFYAKEAVQMLNRLHNEGKERIAEGEFGENLCSDFKVTILGELVQLRKYLLETDTAEVYAGSVQRNGKYGRKVIAKIASEEGKNRYLENEIRVMRILFEKESPQTKHFKPVQNTFKLADGRLGMVSEFRTDFYSLEEIRNSEKWKNGIPEKHMVWVFNRILSAIGLPHSINVVKRNINPANVLIRPRDHNLVLTDWDHAVLNAHLNKGETFSGRENFLAPEILDGQRALPSSDLYSVGKLMIYVLGGDPATEEFPDGVHPRIQSFIKAFVLKSPWQRIGDAWAVHRNLVELVEELWGQRRFLEFTVY